MSLGKWCRVGCKRRAALARNGSLLLLVEYNPLILFNMQHAVAFHITCYGKMNKNENNSHEPIYNLWSIRTRIYRRIGGA